MSSSTISQSSSPNSPFGSNSSQRSLPAISRNSTNSNANNTSNLNPVNRIDETVPKSQSSSTMSKDSPRKLNKRKLTDQENNPDADQEEVTTYKCDFPNCTKIFTRMDHLQRHKWNHNPRTVYNCEVPECTKTFIRKDVCNKHSNRHKLKIAKLNERAINPPKRARRRNTTTSIPTKLANTTKQLNNTSMITSQSTNTIISNTEKSLFDNTTTTTTTTTNKAMSSPADSMLNAGRSHSYPQPHQQPQTLFNTPISMNHLLSDTGIPTHDTLSSIDSIGFSPIETVLHSSISTANNNITRNISNSKNDEDIHSLSQSNSNVSSHPLPQTQVNPMNIDNMIDPPSDPKASNNNNNNNNNSMYSPSNSSQQQNVSPSGTNQSPPQQLVPPSQMIDWLFGERHIPFTPKLDSTNVVHHGDHSHNQTQQQTQQHPNQRMSSHINQQQMMNSLDVKNNMNRNHNIHHSNNSANHNNNPHLHHTRDDFQYDMFSDEFFAEIFQTSPKFPNENNHHTLVNNEIKTKMHKEIPTLIYEEDFEIPQLERFLELYWLLYHCQYPILHKPSFSTQTAHPLLLLTMVMIGAAMSTKSGQTELLFKNPYKLADSIADPIRWLICASDEFKAPVKPWVIQSLLLLECYEICYSSRKLHERAYLNHGLKIQLLRRSPMLGGDPLRNGYEESLDSLDGPAKWAKWIEYESLKRATLMSFYIDTINCTIFGHELIASAHQIKLTLPIEDIIWESASIDTNNFPPQKKTPKFLTALKTLLHGEKLEVSSFTRKILLAGLLSIMFQMEEKDLEGFYMEWDTVKTSWKESISLALEAWKNNLCNGNCCNTEISISVPDRSLFNQLPPTLRPEDTTCKFAVYHIAHTFLRIKQYDFIIYAGAPSRMNVTTLINDYEFVESRIRTWAMSTEGLISVIHSYFFLCEMLLSKDSTKEYVYDPRRDPCMYRGNVVVSALLIIWSYNFVLEGPESNLLKDGNIKNSEFIPAREDGYGYLRRIRSDLLKCLGSSTKSSKQNFRFTNPHTIQKFRDSFPLILNKNFNVGLLRVFKSGFSTNHSEICREYSRMIENCIQRSLGKEEILCADMYN